VHATILSLSVANGGGNICDSFTDFRDTMKA
jgi:hypothetical protein